MIERWLEEIKRSGNKEQMGMLLVHNGIVRATSKDGRPVGGMELSYDKKELDRLVAAFQEREGIVAIRVWINEGTLAVGDDIMFILVAGRFRTDVLPVLQELLTAVKRDVVREREIATPQ